MDDKALDRLFSGDLEQLAPLPKRVVRLFISSTFTDMMLERNSLMERVYPRLKKYCRERHGLDFQVVDMRWGVRDEATDDHQTAQLCSREIDNCQRMSLGPNFVALIGDKYGFRPLCNKIKSTEYRALRRCLIELDVATELLDTWYKEDLNAQPAEYLLQPISSILRNFTNKNEPELQAAEQRRWLATQQRLHELLVIGSGRLVEQGRMSKQEQLMKYSISVTEREVIEGCLNVKEAKWSCLVYVRSIVDIREQLAKALHQLSATEWGRNGQIERRLAKVGDTGAPESNQKASLGAGETINLMAVGADGRAGAERLRKLLAKYIDLSWRPSGGGRSGGPENEWSLDEEAQSLLGHLRSVKLEAKVGSAAAAAAAGGGRKSRGLSKFQVRWDEREGMSLKSEEHKRYLSELTDHFYRSMIKMIRRASGRSEQELKGGLIGEVLRHSHYAKHASRGFYGRASELERVRAYILMGSPGSPGSAGPTTSAHDLPPIMPMFVYGVGGSGKSSVLARAASLARHWIERAPGSSAAGSASPAGWNRRPCIVMRFCCTTPSSSSMVGVLTSVCRQLQYNFYQFGPLNGLMNQETAGALDEGAAKRTRKVAAESRKVEGRAEPQLANEPMGEDFVRLVFTFRQLIENCRHHYHRKRLFLIILDSVERLTGPDSESSLEVKYSWLTSLARLPPNVRLLVSCSSERSGAAPSPDYLHLKRHFLRLYLPLDTGGRRDSSLERSSEPLRHLDAADAAGELPAGAAADGARASLERPREGLASHLLKRFVLPALRLRKGSRKWSTPTSVEPLPSPLPSSSPPKLLTPERATSGEALKRSASSSGLASQEQEELPERRQHRGLASLIGGGGRTRSQLSLGSSGLSGASLDPASRSASPDERTWSHSATSGVHMIHVRPMGVELAQGVLRLWLQEAGRGLSQQQWCIVRRSFAQCSRPIFVRLAYGEIVNWKSYSVQSDSRGLTFGSSLLETRGLAGDAAGSGQADRLLASIAAHYEPHWSRSQLKRPTLVVEREWLSYLAHSERKRGSSQAEPEADQGPQLAGGGRRGASSNTSSICHLSSTIDEAVSQLFARIELQHGYLLTKHSLSYITAARNGICENELEDILSLDDVVLDDVFQYHLPPVRRIPPLLWTRIRNDLPDYLSERDADGIVVNWHHNQFKLVAQRRYLQDRRQAQYIHSNLADYFLGRWADQAKPFRCTKQQILMAAEQLESAIQQSLRDSLASPTASLAGSGGASGRYTAGGSGGGGGGSVASGRSALVGRSGRLRSSDASDKSTNWMQAKADRRVPHQPLHYAAALGAAAADEPERWRRGPEEGAAKRPSRRYNLRKITELPHHLMRSRRFLDLANEVLFNYRWLFAAIEATGLQSLLADFEEASRSLGAALTELEAGAAPETGSRPAKRKGELGAGQLRRMRQQLGVLENTIRLASSSIHSDPQMLAPQLIGRLLPLIRGDGTGSGDQVSHLGQLLAQCDRDGCLDCGLLPTDHCLQAPNGLELSCLEGHSFAIMAMAMAADQRHLLAVSSRFIIWDIGTGEVSRDVDPKCEGSIMLELRLAQNDELAVSYTSSNTILVLDILTQQVMKFHALESELAGEAEHDPGDGRICGLELVDLLGASKFVVWTRRKWFVLQVNKNEHTSSSSMPQRSTIEQVQMVDLGQLVASSSAEIQRMHCDQTGQLSFVELKNSNNQLQLLTVSQSASGFELWREPQVGPTLACFGLDSGPLRQLVMATQEGELYLVRRRSTRWSKPKLIWSLDQGRRAEVGCEKKAQDRSPPLAIDLCSTSTSGGPGQTTSDVVDSGEELAEFERRIDGTQVDDEMQISTISADKSQPFLSASHAQNPLATHLETVLVYLSDAIVVLRLAKRKEERAMHLKLPRDIRNISVQPNRCQIRAIVLGQAGGEYLAAAVGRRLLLYSLLGDQGQYLRSIDAHAARIVQLMPIARNQKRHHDPGTGSDNLNDDRCLSLASASMDKTVKIWNLANLNKDVHTLDRLENPIESMSVAVKRPWVACLGRYELGLWDWRQLRLLARLTLHDLAAAAASTKSRLATSTSGASRLIKCRLSSDGRHLSLASLESHHLFEVDDREVAGPDRKLRLRQLVEHRLPERALVRSLRFFQQDSRLLLTMESPLAGLGGGAGSARRSSADDDDDEVQSVSSGDSPPGAARRLLILCHSIPDGRLLYTIDLVTPTQAAHNGGGGGAAGATESRAASERVRLPVLTRDQLHVVTVECESGRSEPGGSQGSPGAAAAALEPEAGPRKRSSAVRLATLLGVYSAADGLLLRRINLGQLEPYNRLDTSGQQQQQLDAASRNDEMRRAQPALDEDAPAARGPGKLGPWSGKTVAGSGQVCSVGGEQFSRLKAMASYRERRSVVALLDQVGAANSYLVDVNTRQLMATSSIWSGKLSPSGRFGLSRMSKPTGSLRAGAAGPSAATAASGGGGAGSSGLQLLEMGHCSAIQTLLTHETLAGLSGVGRGEPAGHTGNDTDITCGFMGPNESHVYYHNSRLARLLLVRARDGQLVANYKLSTRLAKIKRSPDGYALLLGQADGALTSLALVDPQQEDTLARLGQLPSRRRPTT